LTTIDHFIDPLVAYFVFGLFKKHFVVKCGETWFLFMIDDPAFSVVKYEDT
jgi:hypothetical protein